MNHRPAFCHPPLVDQIQMTANQDTEHLRLLSIFHYVHASIVAFYSLFAMIYILLSAGP